VVLGWSTFGSSLAVAVTGGESIRGDRWIHSMGQPVLMTVFMAVSRAVGLDVSRW